MNREQLKSLPRVQLQRLAKIHGVKGNLKSETIIKQLLGRFPDGVPPRPASVEVTEKSRAGSSRRAEKIVQKGSLHTEQNPPGDSQHAQERREPVGSRQHPRVPAVADDSASSASRAPYPAVLPHDEGDSVVSQERQTNCTNLSNSAHNLAGHTNAVRPPVSTVSETAQSGPEARANNEDTSTSPSAPVRLSPVPSNAVTEPQWTPRSPARSLAPSPTNTSFPAAPVPSGSTQARPAAARSFPQPPQPPAPRITEEQAAAVVGKIADISRVHKARWGELHRCKDTYASLRGSIADMRTMMRQERAELDSIMTYIAMRRPIAPKWDEDDIWNQAKPTRFDEDGYEIEIPSDEEDAAPPLPPGAKPTEIVMRRFATRRGDHDSDVRLSEVLPLTASRRLAYTSGESRKRSRQTPADEHLEDERPRKRINHPATPARAARPGTIIVPPAAKLGAIVEASSETGEE